MLDPAGPPAPWDAAISAPLAAEHYGLDRSLATGIGDNADAVTRFVLVSRPGPPAAADRPRQDDALSRSCARTTRARCWRSSSSSPMRGVNLTRIESRPTGAALGNYCFSIDARATSTTPGRRGADGAAPGLRGRPVPRLLRAPRRQVAPDIRSGTSDAEFEDAQEWLAWLRRRLREPEPRAPAPP